MTMKESEMKSKALVRQRKGNEAFIKNKLYKAVDHYVHALDFLSEIKNENKERSNLCSNIAECYIRNDQYEIAIEACHQSIKHDATNSKAKFRRAKALNKMSKFGDALKDLEWVIKSKNANALTKMPKFQNLLKSVKKSLVPKRTFEQIEDAKKCNVWFLNGHELIKNNFEATFETTQMNPAPVKRFYKDMFFKDVIKALAVQIDIPCEHLLIWNSVKDVGKRVLLELEEIALDLNEEYTVDPNANYTDDQIKNHLIKTKPTKEKIECINDRIGDIVEKKRSYFLFDKRKIQTLGKEASSFDEDEKVFIMLQIFDIFRQNVLSFDYIFIRTQTATMDDITDYIENIDKPICRIVKSMRAYSPHEHVFVVGKGRFERKVFSLLTNGDMYFLELNLYHSYFNSMKPKNIENKSLPYALHVVRNDWERKGMFWYHNFDRFTAAQFEAKQMVITPRSAMKWEQRWTKPLIKHYKFQNNMPEIDEERRKKVIHSDHKWMIYKNTTFEMIRKRLGNYYDVNPRYIEIWASKLIDKKWNWNYKIETRLKWSQSIEWKNKNYYKFDIVLYDAADYDRIVQHTKNKDKSVSKRIKNLAIFMFDIVKPNGASQGYNELKVQHYKNWGASNLLQNILSKIIENPIFGYVFFSDIIEYIREHEMSEEDAKNIDDLTIIKSLKPNRFMICKMEHNNAPTEYYMDDRFKYPKEFSPMYCTGFVLQYLAENDPLIVKNSERKSIWIFFEVEGAKMTEIFADIRVLISQNDSMEDIKSRDVFPILKNEYDEFDGSDEWYKVRLYKADKEEKITDISLKGWLYNMKDLKDKFLIVDVSKSKDKSSEKKKESEEKENEDKDGEVGYGKIPNFVMIQKDLKIRRLEKSSLEETMKWKKLLDEANAKYKKFQIDFNACNAECEQLSKKNSDLLQSTSIGRVEELTKLLHEKEARYEEMQKRNDDNTKRCKDAIENAKKEYSNLQKQYTEQVDLMKIHESDIRSLEKEKAKLMTALDQKTNECDELKAQNAQTVESLTEQIVKYKRQYNDLLVEVNENLNEKKRENEIRIKELKAENIKLAEVNDKMSQIEVDNINLLNECNELKAQNIKTAEYFTAQIEKLTIERDSICKLNESLNTDQRWYQEQMNKLKSENIKLQRENKKLSQNEILNLIDEREYESWNWQQVLKWILSLNDGKYTRYQNSISQNLQDGKVSGLHLKWVNEIDLKSWGIIEFVDIKYIKRRIDRLIQQQQNERQSEFYIQQEVAGGF